jgi:hypothetical protein
MSLARGKRMRRTLLLAGLAVLCAAECAPAKASACAACAGSLSASACVCTCALSPPERLLYALVLFPGLLLFMLYV